MTKALIICLLSLSLCLCHAASSNKQGEVAAVASGNPASPPVITEATPGKKNVTVTETAANATLATTLKPAPSITVDGNTTDNKTAATTTPVAPSTDKIPTTEKITTPAASSPTTIKTTPAPTSSTAPPTAAPHVTEKPAQVSRAFDSPSFFGGIVLTLGLLAIGFMGFKYYKNQTERNYHTL